MDYFELFLKKKKKENLRKSFLKFLRILNISSTQMTSYNKISSPLALFSSVSMNVGSLIELPLIFYFKLSHEIFFYLKKKKKNQLSLGS